MSSPGQDLPLIMSESGPVPTPPITLLSTLLASVAAQIPGYTSNLPGSLIEDVSSTQVGGLAVADTARVEAVNSISPFGANPFILSEYGAMIGIPIGQETNTSVFVQFSGPSGFTIAQGFLVSDGTFTYSVVDGGVIGGTGTGTSPLLFAVALQQGSWAVPAGSVNIVGTSLPAPYSGLITVINPTPGIPGVATGETESQYRARIFQALLATTQGVTRYLKTLLGQVSGVQQRLISVVQQNTGWEVIVGGGDPYEVAFAIFQSLFDLNTLVGSQMLVTEITNATHAQITTNINHGFAVGYSNVNLSGVVGMTGVNGGPYTVVAVIDEKNFTINKDTTSSGSYTSGGVVTPNLRNITVSLADPPDSYNVTFVNPPAQTVTVDITWNTTSTNFVSDSAVSQLGGPAIANYINSITVGQPINLFVLYTTFQEALIPLLDPSLLTVIDVQVNINGVTVSPISGTGIINGDPESYFSCTAQDITITQA